jgi:hypothetical protein
MSRDTLKVLREHHEAATVAHREACDRQTSARYGSSAYYEAKRDAAVHLAVALELWAVVLELEDIDLVQRAGLAGQ